MREVLAHPLVPGADVGLLVRVVQGEHRDGVLDRLEIRRGRAAHPLRGGVRRHEVRMRGLQRLQPREEVVVLLVRDDRRVEQVIAAVVLADLRAQRRDLLLRAFWLSHRAGS